MATVDSTPLVLFSGLAADANVFNPQKLAFPQLLVPDWSTPLRDDTLSSYCDRLADSLRPHGDAFIGGASFGGIIALHVARRLRPLAVVLIGSARSPDELPALVRLARPFKPLIPLMPVKLLQFLCCPAASGVAQRIAPHLCAIVRQFRGSKPAVFKWSLARILDWEEKPDVACPVFHVHGDRDFVIPIRYTDTDVTVAGGGHVISLTHPTEVNDFIRSVMTQILGEFCSAPSVPSKTAGIEDSNSTVN